MKLRDYQRDCINRSLVLLNKGKRVCVVSPTGSGKSVMLAEIDKRVKKAGANCLIVSHRQEILSQLHRLTNSPVESIQSLVASQNLSLLSPKLIAIDECHHYKAPEWSSLFDLFPKSKFIGFTATPSKELGNYFDEIVVAADYPDLVRQGFLTKVRILRPDSFIGPDLWKSPVKAYLKHCKGERAFLFAPTKDASMFYCQQFTDAGVKAVHLDANTPKEERKAHVELFRKMNIDVICNVQILTEGVDVPEASCCILAGNSSSVVSYLQKTGRVLRPHPAKKWATMIDLVGSSWVYGSPIEKREYSLSKGVSVWEPGDKSIVDCPQCAWCGTLVALCPRCGWDFSANKKRRKEAVIYDRELKEVWAGCKTPKAAKEKEWKRLLSLAKRKRLSTYWCAYRYKKTFNEPCPFVTYEQKMEIYFHLAEQAIKKKAKIGQAWYRYKELLSECPKNQWVSALKEEGKRGQIEMRF